MHLKPRRRTPWDYERPNPLDLGLPARFDRAILPEPGKQGGDRMELICLHGWYVFDPIRASSEDFRQFMWSGLRVLREEAKAKGLSDEQVRKLLYNAFEVFHDAADGMWTALKRVVSKGEPKSSPCEEAPAASGVDKNPVEMPNTPFIACEEDRPVPVKTRFSKPLTLLDPDAEILSSFEP
jgi:hypothetical protein